MTALAQVLSSTTPLIAANDNACLRTAVPQLQGTTLHYLHTDQRGAPVKATNASKTVRWSTRYEPFGATTGLTNPGSLVMNLRLPVQYADAESGLYDNGFRTYNPQTGIYLQSDPIGMAGGRYKFENRSKTPINRLCVFESLLAGRKARVFLA